MLPSDNTAPVTGAAPAAVHPAAVPLITLAAALAHAAQLPQVQTIQDEQALSDAQAAAARHAVQGYTAALAPLLAHIAPAVQQGYQQAAGLDALLGKGFGNELEAQQTPNDQQARQILNLSGGQAQLPAIDQAIGGPGVANALGYLNGGLPAQGLNQAGAAFGAAARMLPAAFAGQGQQEVASLAGQQALTDQGFAQKLANIGAQTPGLVLKNEVSLQQQQALQDYRNEQVQIAQQRANDTAAYQKGELSARDYANRIAAYRAQSTAAYQKVEAKLAGNRVGIQQQNANTSAFRAAAAARHQAVEERQANSRLSSEWTKANGYKSDASGQPIYKGGKLQIQPGFTLQNGEVVKSSQSTRGKTLTPEQLQKYTGEITDTIGFLRSGVPTTTSSTGKVTPGKPALNFADALKFMRQHGYMATPQLAKVTLAALRAAYPAAEVGIASGKVAGPPAPSATAPPVVPAT